MNSGRLLWAKLWLTIQTMVYANNTLFCAAGTVVPVVVKIVCITQITLSIPETMVFSNERIFLITETIFPVNEKMVSGMKTMVIVSHTKDSDTKTIVEADH